MAGQGIVPIELELTGGTAHTLWAPGWREGNAEWQAILGRGDDVYLFDSAEELLAFLRSGEKHDFTDHPEWGRFERRLPESAVVSPKNRFDVVGLPELLAGDANHDRVSRVDRIFGMVRGIAGVCDLPKANRMFATNSVLGAVGGGADHFHGAGAAQWSAIGRVIVANWDDVVDELDELHGHAPAVDEGAKKTAAADLAAAAKRVAADREEAAKARAEERERDKEAAEKADPYDSTVWASAGIDPIKISIAGRTLYTLRCYLGRRPVFLGRHGTIHTFSQGRALVRWLLEHDDHDMTALSTWDEVITAANAGELEVDVHPDNVYSFTGIAEDIKAGPNEVDEEQLGRAYELLADSADWAGDDAVNEVLASNQQLAWLLNYLLDDSERDEPVPPFDDEADGWVRLEQGLVARFTTRI
ncbi:hypothetical protein [Corynebacterium sp. 335C]